MIMQLWERVFRALYDKEASMRNTNIQVADGIMTIIVDLKASGRDSASGKNSVIATTGAPQVIETGLNDRPEVSVGVNVFTPKTE
jgi:hypothetical protein